MDMNPENSPATKGDLRAFRDELMHALKGVRDDVTGVQDELKATRRDLSLEIVKTHGRIDRLRDDLRGEMSIQVSGISKKIDGFMSKVGKVDRAQIIADWRMTQIEKRVDKIESRPS